MEKGENDMGVYISKLMDMPEHCYECLLRQGNCCLLLHEAIPPTVPLTRLDDCPLIEIVECKDCKYWTDDMSGNMWCEHAIGGLTEPTDFCSYGERRSDET